jgi:enediyne biosynthesis protein E4
MEIDPPRLGTMSQRTVVLVVGVALVVLVGAIVLGVGALRGGAPAALPAPHFVDETAAAGIAHTYGGDYPYSVGGGVAVWDCNGDGRPDVYLAGGAGPAALYVNSSPVGGALRFTARKSPVTDLSGVTGAYPLDIDGDGIGDLMVLRNGGNVVLRGLGECRFEQVNDRWGIAGGSALSTAFSATWESADALPTLAFGNYVQHWDQPDPAHLCSDNELIRPAADSAHYAAPVPLTPSWCALSMLFSDWDRSGRRDLRVSNDRQYYSEFSAGQEQLWRIAAGQPPRLYTAADGWVAMRLFGMGIATYDLTGDTYPEVYLTSQSDNKLQTLTSGAGHPTYGDIGLRLGVNAARPFTGGDTLPSTAWHPEFQDVNNDGYIDLFVSKGNVATQPDFASRDPSDLFLGQPDGMFVEGADAAGIVNFARARGAALADFNLDGLLDLIEVDYGDPVKVFRNMGAGAAGASAPMGGWLGLRVSQPGPDRDAIGAWLEVRTGDVIQRRELTVGGGHIGGQLGPIHVGLGSALEADVRVTWPDGQAGPWQHVTANGFYDIVRGAPDARPWHPLP